MGALCVSMSMRLCRKQVSMDGLRFFEYLKITASLYTLPPHHPSNKLCNVLCFLCLHVSRVQASAKLA